MCLPEKAQQNSSLALRGTLSPVRFEGKIMRNCAISRDLQDKAGGFLRAADFVVALPGIEAVTYSILPRKSGIR